MATNKDRIEKLELEFQNLKRNAKIKYGFRGQLSGAEGDVRQVSWERRVVSGKGKGIHHMSGENSSWHLNGSKGSNGFAKLDFPCYSGDDPIV
jgi:hypothetical protein